MEATKLVGPYNVKIVRGGEGCRATSSVSKARMGAPDLSAHKGQHLFVLYLNKASN